MDIIPLVFTDRNTLIHDDFIALTSLCTGSTVGEPRSTKMAPNPDPQPPNFATLSFSNSTGQTRAPQNKDNKGRKFFQQMQPTFSIDVPTTNFTKLEFLDNFDPTKDTVVRKKAREWVNKNREISNLGGQTYSKSNSKSRSKKVALKADDEDRKKQLAKRKVAAPADIISSPKAVGASAVDPFGILPNIGRDFDHIIKYCEFIQNQRRYPLTHIVLSANCPEEIPCSDGTLLIPLEKHPANRVVMYR